MSEVALSVQFTPIQDFCTALVARYWETIRDRFPSWRDAPPIDRVMETFGAPWPGPPGLGFSVEGGTTPLRALFENDDGTELVQVQRDRYVRNWRRRERDEVYPRYETLRTRYEADLSGFVDFAEHHGATPQVNQCEVTYVNHVSADFDPHREPGRVFAPLCGSYSDDFLTPPENAEAVMRFVFPWPGTQAPAGRLHAVVRPVHRRADSQPMLAMTLTARGRPRTADPESALEWLDVGHDFLVRAFTSLTTSEMHKVWGRRG